MAAYTELFVDKGTDYSTTITITDDVYGVPINIAGYSFSSLARTSYYSSNVIISFNTSIFDAANGVANLSLTPANTNNVDPGTYVFDVKMVDTSGKTTRVVEGILILSPNVT